VNKNKYLLSAAALAASTIPAIASVPTTTSPAERPAFPIVARATGLTAADLIVGLDGTVAFDVQAQGTLVCQAANTSCSQATNNGC
jgi:streptogramin lyase